jgi:cytoskeletal protein RodZ
MKEETNNEMDLLLRRLGGRPDISVSEGNGDVEHLDADELSAYAENVLPAAARARYTEHLAECARCRELVVQLSSSAGVVPVVESIKAPAPSALRKFLATLFSPLVLRYAVPALGLIVVAAIGLLVLRQKQNAGESVAQNTEGPAARPFVTPTTPEPETKQFYDEQAKEQAASKPEASGSPAKQTAGAAPAAPPPPVTIDQTASNAVAKKEDEAFATASPAAAAPKPTVESEQQAKTEAREEASPPKAANEPPAAKAKEVATDTVTVEDRNAELDRERSASAKNKTPGTVAGIASLRPGVAAQPQGQRDDKAGKDKDSTETKTVAGRRFQKQNGVWIDTAYDSSRTVFTVTRGSESYRALIADEPEIKKIAEQLKGEILLVWKDRTYRIR